MPRACLARAGRVPGACLARALACDAIVAGRETIVGGSLKKISLAANGTKIDI